MIMDDANYWNRFIFRFTGVILGIITAIKSFNGEQWLAIDPNNVLTMQSFNDGFALPLSLIIILISVYIGLTLAQSLAAGDYKKEGAYRAE